MDNEDLFLMLDECINHAKQTLTTSHTLIPFAFVLEHDNSTRSITIDEKDIESRYENLLEVLKTEAKESNITAIALVSNVTIPQDYNASAESGIRIHVEEKAFEEQNKLSARLLYIPYNLFKTAEDSEVQIKLHKPIPVGLAKEIFI